jgi:predicted component of type VI protein secretion system
LGVSRQHAVIECLKEGYFIRDLESTNKTWVNERELVPHRGYKLRSSDLIRLGQMGVYIYFRAELVTQVNCIIKDATTTSIQLTPEYLTNKIGPYLMMVSRIQQIVDTALDRTQLLVVVKAMHIDPDTKQLHLNLFANSELLDFLREKVGKWREEHNHDLRKIWAMEESVSWLSMDPQADPVAPGYADLRQKLHPALSDLSRQCLVELAPDLDENEKTLYMSRLLPALTRLTHNQLYLAKEPVLEPYG